MPMIPRHVLSNIIERDTLAVLGLSDKITLQSVEEIVDEDDEQKPRIKTIASVEQSESGTTINPGANRLRDHN